MTKEIEIRTDDLTYTCKSYRSGLLYVYAVGIHGTKFKIRKNKIQAISQR